jgi:hypothetical protein
MKPNAFKYEPNYTVLELLTGLSVRALRNYICLYKKGDRSKGIVATIEYLKKNTIGMEKIL